MHLVTGSTFAPDGQVEDLKGRQVGQEDVSGLSEVAACSALCNDSVLYLDEGVIHVSDKQLPFFDTAQVPAVVEEHAAQVIVIA